MSFIHATDGRFFPPGWEARLYGKPGGSPLLRISELTGPAQSDRGARPGSARGRAERQPGRLCSPADTKAAIAPPERFD